METIRNYLETMFLKLPNTPEVYKAKNELWQMMEDKYTELKEEGKSENEAVGIVISEFGNLDELANDLGISQFVESQPMPQGKTLSLDHAKSYLADAGKSAYRTALGVMLCVLSVCGPIFFDAFTAFYPQKENLLDACGVSIMFVLIGIAVGLFIYSSVQMNHWNYLKKEPFVTDFSTTEYLHREMEHYKSTYALLLTIGIILCILSVIPSIILDGLDIYVTFWSNASGGFVFILVAIGFFLIVMASTKLSSYKTLLHLNQQDTVGGNYVPSQTNEPQYMNQTIAAIMSVYWPTVTCLYLIWSFLTFDFWISWIIWPIAAIIHTLAKNLLRK